MGWDVNTRLIRRSADSNDTRQNHTLTPHILIILWIEVIHINKTFVGEYLT